MMLLHQSETPAENHLRPTDIPEVASNPQVEAYLDSLCPAIDSGLDESHNHEARNEMRSHIESLIEANIELGDNYELAIEHALEQFGKSRTIRREWQRTCPAPGSMKRSVMTALWFNSMACVTAGTVIPIGIRFADDLGWRAAGTITDLGLYALPATAGLLTGLFAKRRPMLATLYSLLILLIPMSAYDAWNSHGLGDSTWVIGPISQFVIFMLCWIPFGCAGAGVGSLIRWLMKRSSRRAIAG